MNVIFGDPHLRRLAFISMGIFGAGVITADFMYLSTSKTHMSAPYSQIPYKMLLDHQKGCQLLGGKPIILKTADLGKVEVTDNSAKLELRVKGQRRKGIIHTKSEKIANSDEWQLQYAVMRVESGKLFWNVWLHPDEGVETNNNSTDEAATILPSSS